MYESCYCHAEHGDVPEEDDADEASFAKGKTNSCSHIIKACSWPAVSALHFAFVGTIGLLHDCELAD